MRVTSHLFAIFHWLEASPRSGSANIQNKGIMQRYELWEVRVIMGPSV